MTKDEKSTAEAVLGSVVYLDRLRAQPSGRDALLHLFTSIRQPGASAKVLGDVGSPTG